MLALSKSRLSVLVVGLLLALGGCSSSRLTDRLDESQEFWPYLFTFAFDQEGELLNPSEVNRAAARLKQGGVKKLLVLSFGWGNESIDAEKTYSAFIRSYLRRGKTTDGQLTLTPDERKDLEEWMIIGVAWDSSLTGFSHFVSDLLPAPRLAQYLGFVPDVALFPISFWAKSSAADRIGFGGLKDALEQTIIRSAIEPAELAIYGIGHSFGGRILSGLFQSKQGEVPIARAFTFQNNVKGMVLIHPAMASLNLPRGGPVPFMEDMEDFPIVVIQNWHDHANGFLFPIANIPLNAYTATGTEGVVSEFVSCQRRTEQSVLTRTAIDILRIPLSIAYTGISSPVSYMWGQASEIINRRFNYILDSMAQLPLIEIMIWATDKGLEKLDAKQHWGERHKGIFTLGPLSESAGRLVVSPIGTFQQAPVYEVGPFLRLEESKLPWIFVDVSNEAGKGIYGMNYNNRIADFTLGWLDPIGSHFYYHERAIYDVIDRVLSHPVVISSRQLDSPAAALMRSLTRCRATPKHD